MKIYIIGITLLVFHNYILAQNGNKLDFQPLQILDTVSQKTVDKIKIKDVVKNSSFFFTENYGKQKGLFLFEKKANNWIVFNWNDFISNYQIKKHITYSSRYVSISVGAMRSGMGENWYGWFVLFDLKKIEYVVLNTFSHNSGHYDNGIDFIQECSSKIEYLKNDTLKVTETCKVKKEDKNYCDECLKSGIYKLN